MLWREFGVVNILTVLYMSLSMTSFVFAIVSIYVCYLLIPTSHTNQIIQIYEIATVMLVAHTVLEDL